MYELGTIKTQATIVFIDLRIVFRLKDIDGKIGSWHPNVGKWDHQQKYVASCYQSTLHRRYRNNQTFVR